MPVIKPLLRRVLLSLALGLVAAPAFATAYSFGNVGTVHYAISVQALTPGLPAGGTTGKLLIAVAIERVTGQTWTASTGWTSIAQDNASQFSVEVFCRVGDGGANDTLTATPTGTTADVAAVMFSYSGDVHQNCGTLVAHLDIAGNAANALRDLLMPSLTITTADTLVFGCGMKTKSSAIDPVTTISHSVLTKRLQHIRTGDSAMMFACGDQQQTTATNYAGADWTRDGATDESSQSNGFVLSLRSASGEVTPAFASAPVCSPLDFNTMRCVAQGDANTTNIRYCALVAGSTPPANGAAVNTCASALVSGSVASTGSSQNIDIELGSDPLPIADYYFAGINTLLYSTVAAQTGETSPAPAGKQYVQRSGNPAENHLDLFGNASPALTTSDWMAAVTLCDSFALGAAVHSMVLGSDGVPVIDSDFDLSRHNCPRRVYYAGAAAWDTGGYIAGYINNVPPAWVGLDDEGVSGDPFLFQDDIDFDIPVTTLYEDDESDAMTLAVTNNPPGGSVTGGDNWAGPLTSCGIYTTPVFRATDVATEFTDQPQTVTVGELVPNVVGGTGAAAITAIQAKCSFVASAGTPIYSGVVAAGNVISQDPAADTLVPPNQTVTYVLSLGAEPAQELGAADKKKRLGIGFGIP